LRKEGSEEGQRRKCLHAPTLLPVNLHRNSLGNVHGPYCLSIKFERKSSNTCIYGNLPVHLYKSPVVVPDITVFKSSS
jgi:hypothetical protein